MRRKHDICRRFGGAPQAGAFKFSPASLQLRPSRATLPFTGESYVLQVRADRALRSSTSSTASSSASNAATKAAAPGLGSYDDFIQQARENPTVQQARGRPPACAAPEGQGVPKVNTGSRDPLRECMAANDVNAASAKAKQVKSLALQPKVPDTAQASKRSELLDYKQQAIQRERAKQLRKQSAIKIQSFVRGWLRLRTARADAIKEDEEDQVRA